MTMAAGRTKFTRASDGRIVSKATGRAAPAEYFVIGNTVYKPADNSMGRVKVGTVSKLSNAPKRTQAKVETQARKRRTRSWITQHTKPRRTEPAGPPTPVQAGYLERDRSDFERRIQPSVDNRTLTTREGIRMRMHYNYAKMLDEKVADGEITEKQAQEKWQDYAEASEAERDGIWDDLQREEEISDRERYGSPK